LSTSTNGTGSTILDVKGICASYGTYRALFGVTLEVPERGIVALLGSNGAGKSTVARVVSGLVPATVGTMRFAGTDITKLPAHKIARLGLAHVPEGRAVFSSLTVEENLRLSLHRNVARNQVTEVLDKAFDAFPVLKQRRRQLGGTLSGGEQRMLSLATVLAVPPKLLVADELSLGLAPSVVDSVYRGLVAIRDAGCALLVVEQQIDRALSIADHAVLLAHGEVAWRGPATEAASAMEGMLGGGASPADPTVAGTNGSSSSSSASASAVTGAGPPTTGDGAGPAAGSFDASAMSPANWPVHIEDAPPRPPVGQTPNGPAAVKPAVPSPNGPASVQRFEPSSNGPASVRPTAPPVVLEPPEVEAPPSANGTPGGGPWLPDIEEPSPDAPPERSPAIAPEAPSPSPSPAPPPPRPRRRVTLSADWLEQSDD
jgi:branched-chain amino acid transport system ATP-binding protein